MSSSAVGYTGFIPAKGWIIERKSGINPSEFFSKYISTRTPVIVTDKKLVPNVELFLEELTKVDSNLQVELEYEGEFASEHRKIMDFQDFLTQVDNGGLYLTTQYQNQDSVKQFAQPPLDQLLHILPTKIDLIDRLVVNQMNMWMGYSNGQSSKLHFDYHDNLYFVLQGTKEFTIFPPSDYPYLYINGDFNCHENGLFYSPSSNIRSDGAFCEDVGQYKMKIAEDLLNVAQSKEEIEFAENLMDQAMILMVGSSSELTEYESEEDQESVCHSFDDDGESSEDRNEICINMNGKRFSNLEENPDAKELKVKPQSFSNIPTKVLRDPNDSSEFPLFQHATPIKFVLQAGECLYLPCGWFHEVSSSGGRHIAINYWTAPPGKDGYEDDYWKDTLEKVVFEEIQKKSESK